MSERLRYYAPLFLSIPLIAAGIWRVCEYIPIHYDGSYFIFSNLLNLNYANDEDISRIMGHFFFETIPLYYAKWSSQPNIKVTTYLYSASSILVPLFSLISCWWILPRDKKDFFYYPLMGYSIMTLTTMTFDCNELNLVHALMWMLCCLLLRDKSRAMIVSLFVLAMGMAFAYPVFVLLMPALVVMVWWHKEWPRLPTILVIAIFFLINLGLSMHHSHLMPETPGSFVQGIKDMFEIFTTKAAFIICMVFVASFFLQGSARVIAFSAGFFYAICFYYFRQHEYENWFLYTGRVAGILMATFLASFMIIFRKKPQLFQAAAFVLFALYGTAFYIKDWHLVQEDFFQVSKSFKGIVAFEEFSKHSKKFQHSCTHWPAEMFSIMIQVMNDHPVNVIVRKHPDYPESYMGAMGVEEFKRQVEPLGVKFNF